MVKTIELLTDITWSYSPYLFYGLCLILCFHSWMFFRISLDEKPHEAVLVLKVQGSVSGLAVDWIHHLLYWTSQETGSVNVALLDGSSQRQLITGLEKPSAVAVDPLQG